MSFHFKLNHSEWEVVLRFSYHWNELDMFAKRCFLDQENKVLMRIAPKSPAGILFLEHGLATIPAKTDRLLFSPLGAKISQTFRTLEKPAIHEVSKPQEILRYLTIDSPYPTIFKNSVVSEQIFTDCRWIQSLIDLGPDAWICEWSLENVFKSRADKALLHALHALAIEDVRSPHLILFCDLEGDDEFPLILAQCAIDCGLWVPQWSYEGFLFHWVQRPREKADPNVPLHFDTKMEGGFLLEDMRTVLSLMGKKPMRYSESESRLFKKHFNEIAKELHPLPKWLSAFTKIVEEADLRAEYAVQVLESLTLISSEYGDDGFSNSTMQPKGFAEGFLHGERAAWENTLQHLVPPITGKPYKTHFHIPFVSVPGIYVYQEDARQIAKEISSVLAKQELSVVVPLRELKLKLVPYPNILSKTLKNDGNSYRRIQDPKDWEQSMSQILLQQTLWHASCGVLDLHCDTKNQQLGLSLTPLGKALLTRHGEIPLATSTPEGSVIVKPDYEVVFLKASLSTEAKLGVFCKRIHTGHVGALFRITRDSLFQAMENGKSCAVFLDVLQECCSKLPLNVLAEVKQWGESICVASTRNIQILELNNAEDAVHCAMLYPKGLSYLGGRYIEVLEPSQLREIRKQLAKSMVIVRGTKA